MIRGGAVVCVILFDNCVLSISGNSLNSSHGVTITRTSAARAAASSEPAYCTISPRVRAALSIAAGSYTITGYPLRTRVCASMMPCDCSMTSVCGL